MRSSGVEVEVRVGAAPGFTLLQAASPAEKQLFVKRLLAAGPTTSIDTEQQD